MTFDLKNILAILSFLVIGSLVFPMVATTNWDDLRTSSASTTNVHSATASPVDWRAMISE